MPETKIDNDIASGVGELLSTLGQDLPGAAPAAPATPAVPATPAAPVAPAAPAAPAAPVAPAVPAAQATPVPATAPATQASAPRFEDILRAARPGGEPPQSFDTAIEPAPAEPATPAEPAETPPGDPDVPPEAREEGPARNAWAKIKSDLKAAQKKAAALERELAEARSAEKPKPEELTELEQLRKAVQDYENQIGQIEITRSKSFQRQYDTPILSARAKLQRTLAALTERAPEEAAGLVAALEQCKSVQEARELVAGESADVKGVALQGYMELQELWGTRNRAVEDWRTTRPAVETEEERVQTGERLRAIVDSTASALDKLATPKESDGRGSWIFMNQPDDVDWTERRQGLISSARAVLRDAGVSKITPELAEFVLEGAAAAAYRDFGERMFAQVQELRGQLERRNRAMPRVNGSGEAAPRRQAPTAEPVKPLQGGIEGEVGRLVDDFRREIGV